MNRQHLRFFPLLLAGIFIVGSGSLARAQTPPVGPTPWAEANQIVAAVEAAMPVFPTRSCSIKSHGAVADGRDNTAAFKKAIAACATAGGGHVDVPSGTCVTGAIALLDNIDLRLAKGATIKFSGDSSKYPIVLTRYEGIEHMNRSPMIYAYQRTNIAVTGPGTLDATATSSWNTGGDRAKLEAWANAGVPVADRKGAKCRTSFVEVYSSTNVYFQGITLKGSNFWQFHPVLSRNVLFDGVTVTDSQKSNNDALDPESSDNVVIRNSTLKSRDDAIAIKSGRDADGRRINVPTTNVVVYGSKLASSNWGMITLGSELTAGIRGVYVYNVSVPSGSRVKYLLELKGSSQRGGFADQIHLDTITTTSGGVSGAVMFADMSYKDQIGPYTPSYQNITLRNFTVAGAPRVLDLNGVARTSSGMTFFPIGRIAISDSRFTSITSGDLVSSVELNWINTTVNGVRR